MGRESARRVCLPGWLSGHNCLTRCSESLKDSTLLLVQCQSRLPSCWLPEPRRDGGKQGRETTGEVVGRACEGGDQVRPAEGWRAMFKVFPRCCFFGGSGLVRMWPWVPSPSRRGWQKRISRRRRKVSERGHKSRRRAAFDSRGYGEAKKKREKRNRVDRQYATKQSDKIEATISTRNGRLEQKRKVRTSRNTGRYSK